jgi:hypothetical protein
MERRKAHPPPQSIQPSNHPNTGGIYEMSCNCNNANKSIECTVTNCRNHCNGANYCSLERILVGTHEANPTMDQCTDCKSFQMK